MKSNKLTRKHMYLACYNHINRENLKHNGTHINVHQSKRHTMKRNKRRRKGVKI